MHFFVTTLFKNSQNTHLDGDSHLDSDWSGSFYNRLPLVGADNVVNPASDNRCNTDPDAEANQQRLLIAGHDPGSGGQGMQSMQKRAGCGFHSYL